MIAVAYAFATKLGLFFPDVTGIVAAVLPPGGFALAALLLFPRQQRWVTLVTIFITGYLVNLHSGMPAVASVGFIVANVLESCGGASVFSLTECDQMPT